MNIEQIFTIIYQQNGWGGNDSISGTGSDDIQTRVIIQELPSLFKNKSIFSILDIPCGDFYWMKNISLDQILYLGADIVGDLIENNQEQYGKSNIQFRKINLIREPLPQVDLVLCRDCLVHLTFKDIFLVLDNICNSQSRYLLTTTFPTREGNHNIQTGQWRPLNLQAYPFNLPQPCTIINEGCTEGNGAFKDKSLGLWSIDEIRKSL